MQEVRLPDGSTGHSMVCGSVGQCMNHAAKYCGGPYRVVDQRTQQNSYTVVQHQQQSSYNTATRSWETTQTSVPTTYGGSHEEFIFQCEAAPDPEDARLQAETAQEVERFSQDPRYSTHFPRLRMQMAQYVESGQAETLEEAYAKACATDAQCAADTRL
jgi:hypothetical protein